MTGVEAPSDAGARTTFHGRAAVITGAARGLGAAIAEMLAARGAALCLMDRDAEELARFASSLSGTGAEVVWIVGDVTEGASCDAAAAHCVERHGRLDILVNSAGVGGRNAPAWELGDDEWDQVIDVNLGGTFRMCRACVPHMRSGGWGRIVNIASMAGKDGNAMSSHYSSSKAAVIGFTKSLGKELARDGVLVNAIAPAVIDTDILRSQDKAHIDMLLAKIPMGRLGTRDEVARLTCFLLSEDLSFSTGAVFDLSGGRATY